MAYNKEFLVDVSMVTRMESTRATQNLRSTPLVLMGRFWLRTTKYIYSAGLGLTVIAVEYASFWKEAIPGSMTALKVQKFFKRTLVLKLSCLAQSPSPARESRFTGTQSISACSAVSFKNKLFAKTDMFLMFVT